MLLLCMLAGAAGQTACRPRARELAGGGGALVGLLLGFALVRLHAWRHPPGPGNAADPAGGTAASRPACSAGLIPGGIFVQPLVIWIHSMNAINRLMCLFVMVCAYSAPAIVSAAALPEFRRSCRKIRPRWSRSWCSKVPPGGRGSLIPSRCPSTCDAFEYRGGPPAPHDQMAMGSGFIISADGYIVTNNHVAEGLTAYWYASMIAANLTRRWW